MIYTKSNLIIVEAALGKKFLSPKNKGLYGVFLDPDGSTVASNQEILVAVSPAKQVSIPDDLISELDPGKFGMLIPPEPIRSSLNTSNAKGSSLLSQLFFLTRTDNGGVGLATIDVQGNATVTAASPEDVSFPDWKKLVRDALKESEKDKNGLSLLGLSQTLTLLQTIRRACGARYAASPLEVRIVERSSSQIPVSVIVRSKNLDTGQDIIGVVTKFDVGDLPISDWEKKVFKKGSRVVLKKKKKKRSKSNG